MNSKFGTVRQFDYQEPMTLENLPEVDAKICFVEVDDEGFIEIKTLGRVDEIYGPDNLQVLRLSEKAIEQIVVLWQNYKGKILSV